MQGTWSALCLVLIAGCASGGSGTPVRVDAGHDASETPRTGSDPDERGCELPLVRCGDECVNPGTDPDHCGGCDDACDEGEMCLAGECARDCGELEVCGGSCVDLDTDRASCGACDEACSEDRDCRGGACVCPAGHVSCDDRCVTLSTDRESCGRCGNACAEDESCSDGVCVSAKDPEIDCNDSIDNDEDGATDCEDRDCEGATRECEGTCGAGASTCSEGSFGECVSASEPTTEICGDGIDQDCDGSDPRSPDTFEPNNSCDDCALIAEGTDPAMTILGSFDSVDDIIDCYKFEAYDDWQTGESIQLQLQNVPTDHDYAVFLYRGYDDCHALTWIGESDNEGTASESISWPERFGWDDSATYFIRVVRKRGHTCDANYSLTVSGLN